MPRKKKTYGGYASREEEQFMRGLGRDVVILVQRLRDGTKVCWSGRRDWFTDPLKAMRIEPGKQAYQKNLPKDGGQWHHIADWDWNLENVAV